MKAKNYIRISFIICFAFCLAACSYNGSIAYHTDDRYFKESPKIVIKDDRYYLRFVYSDSEKAYGFAMSTQSKTQNDSLIFYLPVTTSSFNMRGKVQLEEISDKYKIKLIEKGKVFWEEPTRQLILMELENN